MPIHKVQRGESLNSIAFQRGFEWKKLWDLPENRSLKERRGDPQVLFEGDEVFYPERSQKSESGGTEATHKFKLPGVPFEVRVRLRNPSGRPVTGAQWFFDIDGTRTATKKTGSDGKIVQKIPGRASSVRLFVNGLEFPLKLRHLDPADSVRGVQQRLANLGYDTGPIDGILGPLTRGAVMRFQQDHADDDLKPGGFPDAPTIRLLRSVHEAIDDDDRNTLQDHAPPPRTSLSGGDSGSEPSEPDEAGDAEDDASPPDYQAEMAIGADAARPMSVACLQTMLRRIGYRPGRVDGIEGPRTRRAVRTFQAEHQLDFALVVDGIAGPKTRTALRRVMDG